VKETTAEGKTGDGGERLNQGVGIGSGLKEAKAWKLQRAPTRKKKTGFPPKRIEKTRKKQREGRKKSIGMGCQDKGGTCSSGGVAWGGGG